MPPDDEQWIYSKHVKDKLFESTKKETSILLVVFKQVYNNTWFREGEKSCSATLYKDPNNVNQKNITSPVQPN
jgi:hypothetical protein